MKKLVTFLHVIALVALILGLRPQAVLAQEVTCESDVVVQADDWLSNIADKFLGSVQAYPAIFEATNAKAATDNTYATIADPNIIEPGWKLCIPTAEAAQTMMGEAGAAAAAPAPVEGVEGGTMTGAWVGPCCVGVDNLNPMTAGGDYHWLNKIYSHLVTYKADYTGIIGDLAADWSVSDDNLSWTFNLQPGVKWHDGTDLTAEDVVFSIELCLDASKGVICQKSGPLSVIAGAKDFQAGTVTSVAGLEAVDAQTVKITTEAPNAPLLDTLSEVWILQKASLGEVPRDQINESDYWTTKAVGAGPFIFSNYSAGQFLETVRNPDYFRGAPKLEKLIRREFKDPAAALLAFDAGEIDFTYLTADEVERAEQNPNATVIPGPSQVDNGIQFNPAINPVFGEPKFRQAIMYAINRQAIVDALYGGNGTLVPCLYGNPLYIPEDIERYDYDPDKATALLAEAGVDPAALGTIILDTYYNDQLSLDVMTAIQTDLAAIGLTVEIQQMDGPAWTKRYYDDKASVMSFFGGANGADPNRAVDYFYSTSKPGNVYDYNNSEFDALLDQGGQEMDPAARALIYQEACRMMGQDLPWIFLWETVRYGYISNRIQNFVFTPAPGGGSYYDQAELWSIKQ